MWVGRECCFFLFLHVARAAVSGGLSDVGCCLVVSARLCRALEGRTGMAPGKMTYRYSKDVYVAPAGNHSLLVVPGETFRAVYAVLGEGSL